MKKVLVIGSTVVDVIINVDHLPTTQEDVHVISQHMSLGGCAFNTSDMIRHFEVPYILFSPVGTGAYGEFVRMSLRDRKIETPIPAPARDNGCCYCFVESSGERTFISYHGAEYLFEKEWFSILDAEDIDSVYICGLEIEETTGEHIVSYLEKHPEFRIYFAPGPRINKINPHLLSRLFALHPVIHLNEEEILAYTKEAVCEKAAQKLFSMTENSVIITLGAEGTYYCSKDGCGHVPGVTAHQIDTIGAGDSHIGAVIACEKLGKLLPEAIRMANCVAARVVETQGALLPDEEFKKISF